MTLTLRDLTLPDAHRLLALNNAAVPAVNELDADELAAILAESYAAVAVVDDADRSDVLGFIITLRAGAAYESENYRWFSARSSDFVYVDRIVVADGARDAGIGRMLYESVFESARSVNASEVLCEVNLDPPNPGSLRFHRRLGFEQVGELATKGGSVVVALLAAPAAVEGHTIA